MSTRSESIGKRVINGIDDIETSAAHGLHSGANGARKLTKASSRWASRQETNAARKTRLLKRRLEKQTDHLATVAGRSIDSVTGTAREAAAASGRYIRKNPWPAVAITSAAALLVGALLGRRSR